ncbi:hypothetical protein FQZ97_1138790 [compost metagenome]
MLAPVVSADHVRVGVLIGGRFTVCPVGRRDVQVLLIGVVPGVLDNGLALGFQFPGQGGEGGGAFAAVPQQLGDVKELVGFVHDDRFQFLRRVLVPFKLSHDQRFLNAPSFAQRGGSGIGGLRFEGAFHGGLRASCFLRDCGG